jgi:hypothetical protein
MTIQRVLRNDYRVAGRDLRLPKGEDAESEEAQEHAKLQQPGPVYIKLRTGPRRFLLHRDL